MSRRRPSLFSRGLQTDFVLSIYRLDSLSTSPDTRMQPIWRAEIAVQPALAKQLIEAQFPALRPVFARLVGEGWDNTAYLVNEAFIFRFPRRLVAVPLIKTEIYL